VKRLIMIAAVFAVFLPSLALAHAPNAIHMKYDMERAQLNVTVQHLVNDPWQHFVKEVVVYKNGREVVKKEFDFQTSHRNLTMPPIELSAMDGDALRVVANCSEGGQGEKTITVGGVKKEELEGPMGHDVEK